ncbi:sporulation inhibitor of replication protein SirA [Halobacillus sp. H74]|uniref:sporulation inhibitor of replication protein SirA n=1 Tax=Halobacillus sp. H74 TaxID=3457436 RepID=UPI003FCCD600
MYFIIFSIKREITEQYYYKADLMKRFFLEWLRNPGSRHHHRQLSYITEPFPFESYLDKELIEESSEKNGSFCRRFFDFALPYDIIVDKNYCCLFQCDSLWQAESVAFSPLRMSTHTFYIIETSGEHYGWITSEARQRLLS